MWVPLESDKNMDLDIISLAEDSFVVSLTLIPP